MEVDASDVALLAGVFGGSALTVVAVLLTLAVSIGSVVLDVDMGLDGSSFISSTEEGFINKYIKCIKSYCTDQSYS